MKDKEIKTIEELQKVIQEIRRTFAVARFNDKVIVITVSQKDK